MLLGFRRKEKKLKMHPKMISEKNTLISSLTHSVALIREGICANLDDYIITLYLGYYAQATKMVLR
jgi:hypothetical protein